MSMGFTAATRGRMYSQGPNPSLQALFDSKNPTLEDILSFPNIADELQQNVDTHDFFDTPKMQKIIKLFFDPREFEKKNFEEARKQIAVINDLLSMRIKNISDFFYNSSGEFVISKRQSDGDSDSDTQQEVLLSPIASQRSRSANNSELLVKSSIDFLIQTALKRKEVDFTRTGYLIKYLSSFYQRNRNDFLNYFHKSKDVILLFINHFDHPSIAEFLNTILLPDSTACNDSMIIHESVITNSEYPQSRTDILKLLIGSEKFLNSCDFSLNLEKLISEFLNKHKSVMDQGFIFHEIFEKDRFLRKIILVLKEKSSYETEITILNLCLSFSKFLQDVSENKGESLDESVRALFSIGGALYEDFQFMISIIFNKYLQGNSVDYKYSSFVGTDGQINSKRNKTLALLFQITTQLLKQKIMPFDEKISISDILVMTLDSFFAFPRCNFIHNNALELFLQLWNEGKSKQTLGLLIENDFFLNWLLSVANKKEIDEGNSKKQQNKYLFFGHVQKIICKVLSNENSFLRELLELGNPRVNQALRWYLDIEEKIVMMEYAPEESDNEENYDISLLVEEPTNVEEREDNEINQGNDAADQGDLMATTQEFGQKHHLAIQVDDELIDRARTKSFIKPPMYQNNSKDELTEGDSADSEQKLYYSDHFYWKTTLKPEVDSIDDQNQNI